LGIVMFATLAVVAAMNGQTEMTVLCVAMLGALLGFIPRIVPGQVFIATWARFRLGRRWRRRLISN